MDIIIFDVELGQSIFLYPRDFPHYGMLIDCGNTPNFNPIDYLMTNTMNLIHHDGTRYILSNLTLTNYDQDHFSGLPYLMNKVFVSTVQFPKNISATELYNLKKPVTTAVQAVCYYRKEYIYNAVNHRPPYAVTTFHLAQSDFPNQIINTNYLSQLVFVQYLETTLCVCGDLEKPAWDIILLNESVQNLLKITNVLIAAHHGRENGYAQEIFNFCLPEVVIFSDKKIDHGTQEDMSQLYGNHVAGNGVILNGDAIKPRKVLTTRNDGHLWIRLTNISRMYRTLRI